MNCKLCDRPMELQEGVQVDPCNKKNYLLYACKHRDCKLRNKQYCGPSYPFTREQDQQYAPFLAQLGKREELSNA